MKSLLEITPLPVVAFLAAFAVSALSGLLVIPWLRRLKLGQTVREEGLKSHYAKTGTPMMGGLLFLIAMLVVGIPLTFFGYRLWPFMLVTLGCGAVGFADDWIKVVRKHNQGVTGKQKMLLLGLVAVAFVAWSLFEPNDIRRWVIPFVAWMPLDGTGLARGPVWRVHPAGLHQWRESHRRRGRAGRQCHPGGFHPARAGVFPAARMG
jgi:phospho-N-acetylmuramoyl-pentapeptide-transferase